MSRALATRSAMWARGRIESRDGRGRVRTSLIEWLRSEGGIETRTLIEVRVPGTERVEVSELVAAPPAPLTAWVWLPDRRRFQEFRGLQPTDPFPGTVFRYEDLAFVEPRERRSGRVHWVREGAERLVRLESAPYAEYQRVETTLDPRSSLPRRVVFYDRAGFPYREQLFEDVREFEGRPFPTRIRAQNRLTSEESLLELDAVGFATRLPAARFEIEDLGHRLRRGLDPVPLPPG